MGRIRVLLAEDHRAVAQRLHDMLSVEFDVVAMVANGVELIAEARRLKPDVIVTDIAMPMLDGLQAADILLREDSKTRVVVISVYEDPELIKRAKEIGVLGYVTKASGCGELLAAVHAAMNAGVSPPDSGEADTSEEARRT